MLKEVSGLGVSVRRRSNCAVRLEGLLKVGVAYQRGHLCFWPVRLGGQVCSLVRKKHEQVKKKNKHEQACCLRKTGKVVSVMVDVCSRGVSAGCGRRELGSGCSHLELTGWVSARGVNMGQYLKLWV